MLRWRTLTLGGEGRVHQNAVFIAVLGLLAATPLSAAEPQSCHKPRIADGGWTDNTAQNGFLTAVKGRYEPQVDLLSVPVILTNLKKQNTLDVWLDNWMPSQTAEVGPFLKDGFRRKPVRQSRRCRLTAAVPNDVAEFGVKDLKDSAPNAENL